MYRLHIKGNRDAAKAELAKRNITFREFNALSNEIICNVSDDFYPQIVSWFTEKQESVKGYGYPDGTLLFYSLV